MYSGGANGSDTMWELISQTYGLTNVFHFYYGNKTPRGNKELTQEEFNEGVRYVKRANKTLQRYNIERYMNLLARNWFQVKCSDEVFAIVEKLGKGGTWWAVQMAIDENKVVHVFDQSKNIWRIHISEDKWIQEETPVLSKKFAGIGTRNINPNGLKAIIDCYDKTTKQKTLF